MSSEDWSRVKETVFGAMPVSSNRSLTHWKWRKRSPESFPS